MKLIQLMLLLAFLILGLISRRHTHHDHDHVAHQAKDSSHLAVDQEIVHNAERLTDTLRQCNQTAHQNKEIR